MPIIKTVSKDPADGAEFTSTGSAQASVPNNGTPLEIRISPAGPAGSWDSAEWFCDRDNTAYIGTGGPDNLLKMHHKLWPIPNLGIRQGIANKFKTFPGVDANGVAYSSYIVPTSNIAAPWLDTLLANLKGAVNGPITYVTYPDGTTGNWVAQYVSQVRVGTTNVWQSRASKGIVVSKADTKDLYFENIWTDGAKSTGGNSAGFDLDTEGWWLKNCWMSNCQNGMHSSQMRDSFGREIGYGVQQDCLAWNNGGGTSTGLVHNTYTGAGGRFLFINCESYNARGGHGFKCNPGGGSAVLINCNARDYPTGTVLPNVPVPLEWGVTDSTHDFTSALVLVVNSKGIQNDAGKTVYMDDGRGWSPDNLFGAMGCYFANHGNSLALNLTRDAVIRVAPGGPPIPLDAFLQSSVFVANPGTLASNAHNMTPNYIERNCQFLTAANESAQTPISLVGMPVIARNPDNMGPAAKVMYQNVVNFLRTKAFDPTLASRFDRFDDNIDLVTIAEGGTPPPPPPPPEEDPIVIAELQVTIAALNIVVAQLNADMAAFAIQNAADLAALQTSIDALTSTVTSKDLVIAAKQAEVVALTAANVVLQNSIDNAGTATQDLAQMRLAWSALDLKLNDEVG